MDVDAVNKILDYLEADTRETLNSSVAEVKQTIALETAYKISTQIT
jgi:hypothetical protein